MLNEILIIGNHLSATGASRAVGEDLTERLRARGIQVFAASSVPNKALRLYDMLRTTWSRRRQFDVAIVDVFSGPAFRFAEAVTALLRRIGKPYVLVLHGGDLPRFSQRYPRRVGRLLSRATVVSSPSAYLKLGLQRLRPDIIEIPNPIECGDYPFRLRNAPRARLIWLRAFDAIYNPTLAPRVLARLLNRHPGCLLTMVGMDKGDGTLAATQAEVQRLDLTECCRILPKVAKHEVPATLAAGDVFLNTTNIDNTPVSVLEAMACGLCVVSTNVGGLPYLITHRTNGMLVPPNDDVAMADAVHEVLTSPGLAAQLSAQGRQQAETCDWTRVTDRWVELLEACVSGSRP